MISIILVSFVGKVRKLRYSSFASFRNLAKIPVRACRSHVIWWDRIATARRGQRTRDGRALQSRLGSADWSVMLTHLPRRNDVQSRQREHLDHGISM
jgi:hypothetical protein